MGRHHRKLLTSPAATRAALADRFEVEPRGMVDIKGKGMMETYFLKH
jgi:hypothetical protein